MTLERSPQTTIMELLVTSLSVYLDAKVGLTFGSTYFTLTCLDADAYFCKVRSTLSSLLFLFTMT